MGLFKSKRTNKGAYSSNSNSREDFFKELQRKTEELREENKAWGDEFGTIMKLREKARELEKEKKFEEALSTYIQSLHISENSERLNINNYAFDIHRVIILHGKLKQSEQLKDFLEDKIIKYPNFQDVGGMFVNS